MDYCLFCLFRLFRLHTFLPTYIIIHKYLLSNIRDSDDQPYITLSAYRLNPT